ncbi:hypothetical protein GCM10012280_58220 [Wenjunlia tyrosinilytica]|uniref:Uncharacterized protein n=1 Tax=Wenjunlia tyrosinilytica TaxID=1544741 RepID=A0A918E1T1_9ACTN|nr:hypothetical protein GCM10012280_58220 [Wenjunlia tyrosinilytica]
MEPVLQKCGGPCRAAAPSLPLLVCCPLSQYRRGSPAAASAHHDTAPARRGVKMNDLFGAESFAESQVREFVQLLDTAARMSRMFRMPRPQQITLLRRRGQQDP